MAKVKSAQRLVFLHSVAMGTASVSVNGKDVYITADGRTVLLTIDSSARFVAYDTDQAGQPTKQIRLPNIQLGNAELRLRGKWAFMSRPEAKQSLRFGVGNLVDESTGELVDHNVYATAVDTQQQSPVMVM